MPSAPQLAARDALGAGDAATAVRLLHGALAGGDRRVSVVHDLVRAHMAAGDTGAAIDLLHRLVAAAPQRADLALHLVVVLQGARRDDDALDAASAALARHPDDPALWRAVDRSARRAGRHSLALDACRRLSRLVPDDPLTWRRLVSAARAAGDTGTLDAALVEWHRLAPDDPTARHLSAPRRGEVLDRADPRYVSNLFDAYADHFDEHLARLGYRTPDVIAELVATELGGVRAGRCADLGCGTGHVGALLQPHADRLTGVDLSPGMLAKARARGCYDDLHCADLVDFLRDRSNAFDLLVSADTLNYLGDLRPVVAAAVAALRPGGRFVGSLEETDEALPLGFRLEPSGRYVHSAAWVESLLVSHGLEVSLQRSVLRRERGADVGGLLFVARRPRTGNLPDALATADPPHFAHVRDPEEQP